MMFLWIPFLILIPFAILRLARPGDDVFAGCGAHAAHTPHAATTGQDPMEIARQRLARGEITPAEFDEIRRLIG